MSSTQERKHEEQKNDKDFNIIVNGRPKVVSQRELTFTEVVSLAFGNTPAGPNVVFTVTYRRGEGNKPEGTMVEGESVKIKEGMVFNVTATDKS